MSDKLRTKKDISGEKFLPEFLSRARIILEALALGEMSLTIRKSLQKQWRYSDELFSLDIHKMIHEGWIRDSNPTMNKYKLYDLTQIGGTVLAAWDNTEKKTLTKIENARHVTKIRNQKWLKQFLSKEEYGFERHDLINQKTYYGKIQGHSIAVHIGNDATLVITPPPMYARDLITGHYKIHQTIIDFCNILNKKWMFDLTIPEPTSHRQYTISDQFAKDMLKLSGGSQIKFITNDGTDISIDRSPRGTQERLEISRLEYAQKYADTPELVRLLAKKVEENSKQTNEVAQAVFTLAENQNKLFEKLDNLLSPQLKSGQEQVKPLNRDSLNMFG